MKGLLLMIAGLWLGTYLVQAQDPVLDAYSNMSIATLQKVTGQYYKTLPYQKSFSRFLKELMADSDLQDQVIRRRTDSTFFFASGNYKRFNPFIYRPSAVKLIVAEAEFRESDTTHYRDTIIYYQLLVTADSSQKAENFVKKEYNRLLRKTSHKFSHDTQALGQPNNARKGALARCYISPFMVCPITFGWGQNEDSGAYVLSISLAMKVQQNQAGMITLPDEPVRNTSQHTWFYEK